MQLGGFFGTKNNAKYSPYSLERPTTQVSFQVPSETPSQASLAFSSSGLRAQGYVAAVGSGDFSGALAEKCGNCPTRFKGHAGAWC